MMTGMPVVASKDEQSACVAVVDHLATHPGYKPSVYLERGGRLRCLAARTYRQVFDGIPPGVGLIGRTFVAGEPSLVCDVTGSEAYLEITPGVVAEIAVPLVVSGRVVGVLNVESVEPLAEGDVATVRRCAEALEERLDELGGGLRETPAQRLLRHATTLTDTKARGRVEREVLEAATDVSGMDSALLLVVRPSGEVAVVDAVGALAEQLRDVPEEALSTVAGFVAAGPSCFTVGEGGGQDFAGLAMLRDAGAGSMAILGLSTSPRHVLLVADLHPQEIATETIELLELLCAHAATALRMADLVGDLRVQAETDPLTGLGHHRAFHERLRSHAGDAATAVLMIDLDGFKAVNDTQGHAAGDRLLREVAAVLEACVRDEDGPYRIGGDEFAVLAEAADEEEAMAIGARLACAVREHSCVTASIGVAFADAGANLKRALLRADAALYAAKADGRDGVRLAARD